MPESEDDTRYTTAAILAYVESWLPGYTADTYRIEEVRDILQAAADNILDEENGIEKNI